MAAWEFGAGRYPHWRASLFCAPLMLVGLFWSPRRTFAAYKAGQRSEQSLRRPGRAGGLNGHRALRSLVLGRDPRPRRIHPAFARGGKRFPIATGRARQGGGALVARHGDAARAWPPFAPPYLVAGDLTASPRPPTSCCSWPTGTACVPPIEARSLLRVNQVELTIADVDRRRRTTCTTRSPAASITRTRKPEAAAGAPKAFRARPHVRNSSATSNGFCSTGGGPWLLGRARAGPMPTCRCSSWSRACSYAFPRRMGGGRPATVRWLMALRDGVAALPELPDYLASDRRLPVQRATASSATIRSSTRHDRRSLPPDPRSRPPTISAGSRSTARCRTASGRRSARSSSSTRWGRRSSRPATASTSARIRISTSPPSPICSPARSTIAIRSAPSRRSSPARSI